MIRASLHNQIIPSGAFNHRHPSARRDSQGGGNHHETSFFRCRNSGGRSRNYYRYRSIRRAGAGTFFAGAGSNFGIPSNPSDQSSSSILGATWNFNFFVGLEGGTLTSSNFEILLTYDTDPADGNGGVGVINLGLAAPGVTEIQGSQNLLFGFLAVDFPPILDAPDLAFNPNIAGTYEFTLSIAPLQSQPLASVAIDVVVETPEPGALALFGLGLLGYGLVRRRRKAA